MYLGTRRTRSRELIYDLTPQSPLSGRSVLKMKHENLDHFSIFKFSCAVRVCRRASSGPESKRSLTQKSIQAHDRLRQLCLPFGRNTLMVVWAMAAATATAAAAL